MGALLAYISIIVVVLAGARGGHAPQDPLRSTRAATAEAEETDLFNLLTSDDDDSVGHWLKMQNKFVDFAFSILFFVYPGCSQIIFSTWDCEEFDDGTTFLRRLLDRLRVDQPHLHEGIRDGDALHLSGWRAAHLRARGLSQQDNLRGHRPHRRRDPLDAAEARAQEAQGAGGRGRRGGRRGGGRVAPRDEERRRSPRRSGWTRRRSARRCAT